MARQSKSRLLIRADASSEIGFGHVMRCLALAQNWVSAGGEVAFASYRLPAVLRNRLSSESIATIEITHPPGSIADAKQLLRTVEERQFDSVVLDGYLFGLDYQQLLHREEQTLLVVDDFQYSGEWSADLVLNQNLHASSCSYSGATKQLLGPNFAMLRKEITDYPNTNDRSHGDLCNVLLTLGGSNTGQLIAKLLAALALIDVGVNVRVIAANSPRYQQHELLRYRHPITVLAFAENMAQQYVWADVIVSAAGSSCWEWLFFQRTGMVTPIAMNQVAIAESLQAAAMAVNLGWYEDLDQTSVAEQLEKLVRSGEQRYVRKVVDGMGASRVVQEILAFNAGHVDSTCCQ